MNSLLAREKLVERASGGHLHHQHERFSLTESNHAHDERITQLMHNLGLSHHFILYWFFILILQHFNCHINLFATQEKETWAYEVNLFRWNIIKKWIDDFPPLCSPFHFEDTFLDTAEVARTKLNLVDHELVSLDEQGLLLAFIWIIIRTDECIMVHRQRWTWKIGS